MSRPKNEKKLRGEPTPQFIPPCLETKRLSVSAQSEEDAVIIAASDVE